MTLVGTISVNFLSSPEKLGNIIHRSQRPADVFFLPFLLPSAAYNRDEARHYTLDGGTGLRWVFGTVAEVFAVWQKPSDSSEVQRLKSFAPSGTSLSLLM